ncbi:nucleotidyltransferase family protein, partial [Trifolium medium]|nr:nucleotidyltransferase family protein [Trifolium medium]
VEDFTDRSENVARAVRDKGFQTIYKCIQNSIDYLSRFLNSEIQGIELMDHLFGKPKVSTLGVEGVSTLGVEGTSTSNINEKKNNPPALQNPRPSKKRHFRPSKPEGTDQLHVPPSSNVPNGLPSMVSTLGVEGTSTSNINENKNNPRTLQTPRPPKKTRLVKNKVRDLQQTESSGTAQVHVPPSSNPLTLQTPRPPKKTHLVKNQVRDLQRTGPSGTAQVHVPPRSNPPTFQNSYPPENRYLVNNHVRDFQQTE